MFEKALAETGRVGIGKVVMREKQHLVAVESIEGRLVLTMMRYADEVVDVPEVQRTRSDRSAAEELKLATRSDRRARDGLGAGEIHRRLPEEPPEGDQGQDEGRDGRARGGGSADAGRSRRPRRAPAAEPRRSRAARQVARTKPATAKAKRRRAPRNAPEAGGLTHSCATSVKDQSRSEGPGCPDSAAEPDRRKRRRCRRTSPDCRATASSSLAVVISDRGAEPRRRGFSFPWSSLWSCSRSRSRRSCASCRG